MFDLSRIETLSSVRSWYRQVRSYNRSAIPILVGTKFDIFEKMNENKQLEVALMAHKFAKAMRAAAMVFTSAKMKINIKTLFKLVFASSFELKKCNVPMVREVDQPIVLYDIPRDWSRKNLPLLLISSFQSLCLHAESWPQFHYKLSEKTRQGIIEMILTLKFVAPNIISTDVIFLIVRRVILVSPKPWPKWNKTL